MDIESIYRQEKINKYRNALGDMFRYIPWLEKQAGSKLIWDYNGDNRPGKSVQVPVYDSTLLAFIKEMQKTGLLDRNYVYVYSHYGIKNAKDEIKMINRVELKEIDVIFGIMSKYILGGMTKARLWPEAVQNGVYLSGLKRVKELLDIWDKPLA